MNTHQTQTEERTLTRETLIEESKLAQETLDRLNNLITLMDPEAFPDTDPDPTAWSRQECEPDLMNAVDRLYDLLEWYDEQIDQFPDWTAPHCTVCEITGDYTPTPADARTIPLHKYACTTACIDGRVCDECAAMHDAVAEPDPEPCSLAGCPIS